jgi:hypothetical protein
MNVPFFSPKPRLKRLRDELFEALFYNSSASAEVRKYGGYLVGALDNCISGWLTSDHDRAKQNLLHYLEKLERALAAQRRG